MVDGSTVASEGVQFRHDFRYPRPGAAPAGDPGERPGGEAGDRGKPIGYPGAGDEAEDAGDAAPN
jgi:hypothetical protein